MKPWYPKPEDLTAYMLDMMEASYTERERQRCSRDDFFDGYLSALRVLRSRSSFKPGRWEAETAPEE